jgi:hypothetical protein
MPGSWSSEQQGLLYGGNPGLNGVEDRQRFASSSSQQRRQAAPVL